MLKHFWGILLKVIFYCNWEHIIFSMTVVKKNSNIPFDKNHSYLGNFSFKQPESVFLSPVFRRTTFYYPTSIPKCSGYVLENFQIFSSVSSIIIIIKTKKIKDKQRKKFSTNILYENSIYTTYLMRFLLSSVF